MKQSRFTDSQIMAVLKEAEAGVSVPELGRTHGISTATLYKWRTKFADGREDGAALEGAGGRESPARP